MTDLLGTMLSWSGGSTVIEAESGERVEIAVADIVSGKPVPPRPSPRLRVSPEDAERRALAGWPPVESMPLGSWVLRASGGFSARANSVLAVDEPGTSYEAADAAVRAFYAERGLPPWAQVVVGSDTDAQLVARGWGPARPGEADTDFLIASVAQVRRALRRPSGSSTGSPHPEATLAATAGPDWLAGDTRAEADPKTARAVLEGPGDVAFVSLGSPPVAKGRVSLVDDWAGITDVWVSAERRRQGLGLVVIAELLQWAAERGASTAYLQVRGDNPAALALYGGLGFARHHSYRYLTPA